MPWKIKSMCVCMKTVWLEAPTISDVKWTLCGRQTFLGVLDGTRLCDQHRELCWLNYSWSRSHKDYRWKLLSAQSQEFVIRFRKLVLPTDINYYFYNLLYSFNVEMFNVLTNCKHYVHSERPNWWYKVCAGQWSNLKWHRRALPAQIPLISISSH